jgi:uncharacterized membrane protein YoaK (UPF0700 family)
MFEMFSMVLQVNGFELDAGKLYLIGLVASIVAQGIKIIYARQGKKISKRVITVIAFVIAIVLAYIFAKPELPPATDPMEFALALVSAATAILGSAVAIYNVALETLLQKLGDLVGVLLEP